MADNGSASINMSYPVLITTCNAIHSFMVRDTTQFTAFGVLTANITAFQTKITDFEALPTDDELSAVLVDATTTKNTIANDLRIMIRGFAERARMAFGAESGKYKLFHNKDLTKMNDSELLVFGRMVKRSADLYHTELLVYGLTALMITNLNTKNNDFEDAINDQRNAVADRDAATNNRAKKAVELYDLLTSYCETGKVIWYETNEAYYNDYVIFGSNGQPVTLIAPDDFSYDSPTHKFAWTAIENATSYAIESSVNHTDWSQLWTGSDTQFEFIPTTGPTTEYRCRGRNSAGYGPFCDAITIIYVEPLPPPASISVTTDNLNPPEIYIDLSWAAVVGATYYKVFESMVNIGQPAGTYTDIGDFTVSNLRKLAIRNHRYYYHVKAGNVSTMSNNSTTVEVDVPL